MLYSLFEGSYNKGPSHLHMTGWYPNGEDCKLMLGWVREHPDGKLSINSHTATYGIMITEEELKANWIQLTREQFITIFKDDPPPYIKFPPTQP